MIQSLAAWFNGGGTFMWAILAVLAIAVAVTLERIIFYYIICRRRGTMIVAQTAQALNSNNAGQAAAITAGKAPVNILLQTALDRYSSGMSIAEIQEGVEEAAIQEVPRLTERLNYLVLFANIATLLGLLGTITGLQTAFSSLGSVEASKKAAMLAAGISELMVCTAFGLMVAIPCMIAYTFLQNKQGRIAKDLDESVVRFMNYLKKKETPQRVVSTE
ncbi:MAG: MotA/TolQ/ExbB proton channel family protein [Chitinispirillaceae bacterium]|jgi:biopolymer transport protein ExbB/TolQ|nr:MotA/TolQ/ExbB proton channel family protein [Chitinispirillaceae bacterium]